MNPLTLVKRIQNLNSKEAALGISDDASWHAKYKDSAYVFVGGIPFDLTEGDLLAVFAQYGEIVDVNLVRDIGTGKSKGFAFIAYEDQRSTNLAVDNLNGAQILGRTIRVDHVSNYKKKEEEDEETRQKKREERGICRAFQRGQCNRGDGCKFSHDEQRGANSGWGPKDSRSLRWGHDKFEGSRSERPSEQLNHRMESTSLTELRNPRTEDEADREKHYKKNELRDKELESKGHEKRSKVKDKELNYKKDGDRKVTEKRSMLDKYAHISREDGKGDEKRSRAQEFEREAGGDRRDSKRSRSTHERSSRDDRRDERRSRFEAEPYYRDDQEDRVRDKRSAHDRDLSSRRLRQTDEDQHYRSRR